MLEETTMIRKKTKVAHPLLAGVRIECIEAFFEDACTDPHAILGVHEFTWSDRNGLVVRVFHPDATAAEIIVEGKSRVPAESIARGLFAAFLPGRGFPLNYQVCFHFTDGKSLTGDDPYRFMPTLNEEDLKLLAVGRHLQVYEKLGAHPRCIDGCEGVAFAVWAPNAKRVSLIGEFNGWDGRILPMRRLGSSGIWELFVPGIQQGMLYKFELKTQEGMLRPKTDPFAFAMELRPGTASQVCGLSTYQWEDAHWME
jgi:1,4-alpha-glucan branching enzyme